MNFNDFFNNVDFQTFPKSEITTSLDDLFPDAELSNNGIVNITAQQEPSLNTLTQEPSVTVFDEDLVAIFDQENVAYTELAPVMMTEMSPLTMTNASYEVEIPSGENEMYQIEESSPFSLLSSSTIQLSELEEITAVVSPGEVLSEISSPCTSSPVEATSPVRAVSPIVEVSVKPAPKKRGRKPSLRTTQDHAIAKTPRRRRERKVKVYEVGPFEDEELERKRINAVNAKRHRDMQKKERENLKEQLQSATTERDQLLQEVIYLRDQVSTLQQQLQEQKQPTMVFI